MVTVNLITMSHYTPFNLFNFFNKGEDIWMYWKQVWFLVTFYR